MRCPERQTSSPLSYPEESQNRLGLRLGISMNLGNRTDLQECFQRRTEIKRQSNYPMVVVVGKYGKYVSKQRSCKTRSFLVRISCPSVRCRKPGKTRSIHPGTLEPGSASSSNGLTSPPAGISERASSFEGSLPSFRPPRALRREKLGRY